MTSHELSTAISPVLVLGSTGFIGQPLVRRLRRAGLGMRALVRYSSPKAAVLADQGVEVMIGDFTDPARLDDALSGVHHVYHLARGAGSSWDDYLRNDVAPSRRLAERCAERGVRLYYTSSIAIYHGGRDGKVIDETTPAVAAWATMNMPWSAPICVCTAPRVCAWPTTRSSRRQSVACAGGCLCHRHQGGTVDPGR